VQLVDYRCNGCGATHEVFASSPVADSVACPDCGATARRRFGLGGLLGVRPARKAKERLDRERATKEPLDAAGRQRLRDHLHGHDHHHAHDHHHDDHDGHEHHHAHDHDAPQKESSP
jgi:putative FmdB family regulatory protein